MNETGKVQQHLETSDIISSCLLYNRSVTTQHLLFCPLDMSSPSSMSKTLFQAPHSAFDPTFWEKLYDLKLNVLKLDSSELPIRANAICSDGKYSQPVEFSSKSYDDTMGSKLVAGTLVNVNTVEEFRDYDKKKALKRTFVRILTSMLTLSAAKDPSELKSFILLAFSDLKAYRFTYWLGVPAVIPDTAFTSTPIQMLRDAHFENGCSVSVELYRLLLKKLQLRRDTGISELQQVFALRAPASGWTGDQSESHSQMQHIQHADLLTFEEAWPMRHDPSVHLVVLDSTAEAGGFGWTLRNLLVMLAIHAPEEKSAVKIIGLRGSAAKKLCSVLSGAGENSEAVSAQLLNLTDDEILSSDESVLSTFPISASMVQPLVDQVCALCNVTTVSALTQEPSLSLQEKLLAALDNTPEQLSALAVVGWETNERGKPGPRVADLSQALDSSYLMAQAVDLNLRLMKWRLWPSLDTECLANTRCLLLGAGTLGCAVARALLGWGVRDITLVDNGRVSYSNPARQCLFEFEDAEARSFKAVAAAARLRKIFPGVRSEGVVLSIPMPGHPLNLTPQTTAQDGEGSVSEDEVQYRRLDELIRSHDVCFALTDSREARWLPTVMCAAYGKLLINTALGFDTYLVMRHGQTQPASETQEDAPDNRLGCYFCNDIVAASNSQKDRTLDQQCTVTRPGLSFIAAALAVELMVALAHPQKPTQNEYDDGSDDEKEGKEERKPASGAVTAAPEIPHQIRGSVAGFTQFTPHAPAFNCCTACSAPIVQTFLERGFDFVQQACQDSSVLEATSGITRLMEFVDVDDVGSDDDF